ncbi:MAG: hypothetical protein Q9164_002910 [Protoblastenia rupestris]
MQAAGKSESEGAYGAAAKRECEEKLQNANEELDRLRREREVIISQLEEDKAALEKKLSDKTSKLDGERRERRKKEKALEDRIVEVENVITNLGHEKQSFISEYSEKFKKLNAQRRKQLEDYEHLRQTLVVEQGYRQRAETIVVNQGKTIDGYTVGRPPHERMIAKGQRPGMQAPMPKIEHFTETLASQIHGLHGEIARLETDLAKERQTREGFRQENRHIQSASQQRIKELENELGQVDHGPAERAKELQEKVDDLQVKLRIQGQSLKDKIKSLGGTTDESPSTPGPNGRNRRVRKNKKGPNRESPAVDPESIRDPDDDGLHSTHKDAEGNSHAHLEDVDGVHHTPGALKHELGSQHNSDAKSLSSHHTQDDDPTLRFNTNIPGFAPPAKMQSTQDWAKSQIFEVANIEPKLQVYKDATTQIQAAGPPATDSQGTQTDSIIIVEPKTNELAGTQTEDIKILDSAKNETGGTQTKDIKILDSAKNETAGTQTKDIKILDSAKNETTSTQTTQITIVDEEKNKEAGIQTDLPIISEAGTQTDAPAETCHAESQTNPNTQAESSSQTEHVRIIYPSKYSTRGMETQTADLQHTGTQTSTPTTTTSTQTSPLPTMPQTTFYTDLKAWLSHLFTYKVRTIIYTLLFLLLLFTFIWSLYHQSMALKERNMWLRANDVSRRSTILIRHSNSKNVRIGWLWEAKLLKLEAEPMNLAEKYAKFGSEY